MTTAFRFTSADLERLPDIEGVRYEIIDGDLHASRAPGESHQYVCMMVAFALHGWSERIVELYRREDDVLRLAATLSDGATLTSPLLLGFACEVSSLWAPTPRA